ncbi:MAG: Uracil-DNA glycosylase [Pseudomonadales bacterium]|nr:Uracil-DNA glycosylase [Pseudomonadales bacterium]
MIPVHGTTGDAAQTASGRTRIDLEPSWLAELGDQFEQPYMHALREFLRAEKRAGKTIYPAAANWFAAFRCAPFAAVEVVVLGQDPYHGPGQAHGLCFSVPRGVAVPPSLQNIFEELRRDLGITPPAHGCLEHWAGQGVLLLNSVLTVERGRAGSHQGRGWETFTDRVVQVLNERRERLVFMLWGSYAERKGRIIDRSRHLVLSSPHPSPLSAYRGFIGNGHFSAANGYLAEHGQRAIDWRIPP